MAISRQLHDGHQKDADLFPFGYASSTSGDSEGEVGLAYEPRGSEALAS